VTAEIVEDLGSERQVIFPIDAPRVATEATRAAVEADSDEDAILLADDQRALFCARLDDRTVLHPGETVDLAVDNTCFHFFDPDTGRVLGKGSRPPEALPA
jgi:multiple sugar transport system ATP-binding protein